MDNDNIKKRLDDIKLFYKNEGLYNDLDRIERNNLRETEPRDKIIQSGFMKSVGEKIKKIDSIDPFDKNHSLSLIELENDINKHYLDKNIKRGSDINKLDSYYLKEIYKDFYNSKYFPLEEEKRENKLNVLNELLRHNQEELNEVNLAIYFKEALSIDCKDKNEMLNHFDKVIDYEINQIKTNRKITLIDNDLEELSKLPQTEEVVQIIKDYKDYKDTLIEQSKMDKDLLEVIIKEYNIENIKSL